LEIWYIIFNMDTQDNSFDEALEVRCWSCKAAIDTEDNFCRVCGKGREKHISWYYTHWGAVILTFMFGPFSLYFIWKSPVLSDTVKWIYTAIIFTITWYITLGIYNLWVFIQQFMGQPLPY
jgi:zinc-ribbon domain